MTGYVYFVKPVGQSGPIKIGHSAFPPERLAALQTWNPAELEIAAKFVAAASVEKALHERFARWHIRGEWFEATDELVSLIAGISDGGEIGDLIDLSIRTGTLRRRPKTASAKAKVVGSFKRRVESARQYASGVSGRRIALPGDVWDILSTAGGYRQEYRDLTPDEIETLEEFISRCRNRLQTAA